MGDFDQNLRYIEHILRYQSYLFRYMSDTKNVDFIDFRYFRGVKGKKVRRWNEIYFYCVCIGRV